MASHACSAFLEEKARAMQRNHSVAAFLRDALHSELKVNLPIEVAFLISDFNSPDYYEHWAKVPRDARWSIFLFLDELQLSQLCAVSHDDHSCARSAMRYAQRLERTRSEGLPSAVADVTCSLSHAMPTTMPTTQRSVSAPPTTSLVSPVDQTPSAFTLLPPPPPPPSSQHSSSTAAAAGSYSHSHLHSHSHHERGVPMDTSAMSPVFASSSSFLSRSPFDSQHLRSSSGLNSTWTNPLHSSSSVVSPLANSSLSSPSNVSSLNPRHSSPHVLSSSLSLSHSSRSARSPPASSLPWSSSTLSSTTNSSPASPATVSSSTSSSHSSSSTASSANLPHRISTTESTPANPMLASPSAASSSELFPHSGLPVVSSSTGLPLWSSSTVSSTANPLLDSPSAASPSGLFPHSSSPVVSSSSANPFVHHAAAVAPLTAQLSAQLQALQAQGVPSQQARATHGDSHAPPHSSRSVTPFAIRT